MCVDLLYIYILPWVVGKGRADDGVEEGGGDAEVAVRRQDCEGLNVEEVGLLMRSWEDR